MNKKVVLTKAASAALAATMVAGTAIPAMAASSADADNNTATKNDLANSDIIDMSKTGSITIKKYDLTSAQKDGVMGEDGTINGNEYESTGEVNESTESTLEDYLVDGVGFTYLYCGRAETHSIKEGTKTTVEVVYEIPERLREILGLSTEDAIDMTTSVEANPCDATKDENGKAYTEKHYHYTSTQINKAMETILEKGAGATEDDEAPVGKNDAPAGNKSAKDALEEYLNNPSDGEKAVQMTLTGENGMATGTTSVSGLELGLYLIVETSVPEEVVETVNPWFVTLPFTNSEGTKWLYDATCYPKNQTGNPDLDKLVRNATGALDSTDEVSDGAYGTEDYTYITSNLVEGDKTAEVFAAERGDDQTTAGEYNYEDTTTASEGDVLDYILVSHIPHIQSEATYLTDYSFYDTLTEGITYNNDARIAFYATRDAAMVNDTSKAVEIWGIDLDASEEQNKGAGNYGQEYVELKKDYNLYSGSTEMSINFTEAGLKVINEQYSDYYIVIYYTGTLNSDATAILGDAGNANDVTLVWKRTSEAYYNTLEDRCYVYTFGIDMTKLFSDGKGDPTKVQFKMYNETDGYYVVAEEGATIDGERVYYVTGKTTSQDEATVFSPLSSDSPEFKVYGLEGDTYQLTEIATDTGYSLLKDQIEVVINTTTRNIDPASCGYVGSDADTGHTHTDECYGTGISIDAYGKATFSSEVLYCGQAATEEANGRTTEKTPMLVEDVVPATGSVDGIDVDMTNYYVDGDTKFDGTTNTVLASNYKEGTDTFQAVLAAISGATTGENNIDSEDGIINIEVTNNTTTKLPQTGGSGLYAVTIAGIVAAAGGCMVVATRKKKSA